jgi:uncharacterized protein with HEPN domain
VSGRNLDLLLYIQQSIARIEGYTLDGRDAFLSQNVLQDAVLRRLETLADAAGRLSPALKARHPHIPWRDISGFRNVAAHGYLELDVTRVWTTVQAHLPALKAAVEEELHQAPDP